MKGPGPCRVSTRPAAVTADTRVLRFDALDALATMVSLGLMAAPPTIGSVAGAMAAPSAGAMAVDSAGVVAAGSLLPQAPSAISAPPDTATSMRLRRLVIVFRSLWAALKAVTGTLRAKPHNGCMSRDKTSQLHHSVFEHHRLCAVQQNAVFEVATHGARQDAALDISPPCGSNLRACRGG